MFILLFFAFISGLVTILAPCIWPLLPIVLSASATGGRRKPLGITIGIISSFTFFTLSISYLLQIFSFDPDGLRFIAVVIIGILGLTLVVPALGHILEGWVSRISGRFALSSQKYGDGFIGGLVVGISLGIVWTPCAGPILATIATLAATQAVNLQVVLVTIVYGIGVGIPLFFFAAVGRRVFAQSSVLNKYTGRIQQVFGVIMVLTAVAIYTNFDKTLQTRLLDAIPAYQEFINNLESSKGIEDQLDRLKKDDMPDVHPSGKPMSPTAGGVKDLGGESVQTKWTQAPEFTGISQWLNTESPLTIAGLRGKVVLIDFWTYTCINCIRTLPYVTSWYDTYKEDGFVVVGVHTPEFAFEKKTENVLSAIARYNIHYPVAQDNDYRTWRDYDNHYWPAHYLVDANGIIRYVHYGEGRYQETERAVQDLLKEAGSGMNKQVSSVDENDTAQNRTPELYLGLSRIEHFWGDSSLLVQGPSKFPTVVPPMPEDRFAFEGEWILDNEYAESGDEASLVLHFKGKKVFLVTASDKQGGYVEVLLDGSIVSDKDAGKDTKDGVIELDKPRLYEIIDLQDQGGTHILKLRFLTPGIRVFAFTFG